MRYSLLVIRSTHFKCILSFDKCKAVVLLPQSRRRPFLSLWEVLVCPFAFSPCLGFVFSQPLIYFSITVVRFLFYSPSPPPVFRGINWRSINCIYLNCTIWVLTYLSTCESVTIVKIMGIYTTSQSSLVSLYSPSLPHLQVITHLACVTKG